MATMRAELGAEIAAVRADLVRTRADIMERIDRLQNAVTLVREEEVVSLGAAERAERMALSTREEVRSLSEQLSVMVRQIRRLQSDVRKIRGDP